MGSYWIHVDTETLRIFAKGYDTRTEVLDQVGKSIQNAILTIIDHTPDYDGRLQLAARPDALEIGKQCRVLSNEFMDDSYSLIRIAKAFEDVDGQAVKVFGYFQDTSSKAYFFDQGGDPSLWVQPQTVTNPDGSVTTTTSEVFINPDGSSSTVIIVRTTFPDGRVKETKTIRTQKVIDSGTADAWNQNAENAKLYLTMGVCILLGFSAEFLLELALVGVVAEEVAALAGLVADGVVDTGTELLIEAVDGAKPDRGWQGGDTVTNTITVETTYYPHGSPTQQVTNTTVVTDRNGTVVSSETTGTHPPDATKSATPHK